MDRSLITGRGATKRGGGASEVYPYRKWGLKKHSAMLKGAGGGGGRCRKGVQVVLTWELEVLAILNGGQTCFHLFREGEVESSTLSLEGGAQNVSYPPFSLIVECFQILLGWHPDVLR